MCIGLPVCWTPSGELGVEAESKEEDEDECFKGLNGAFCAFPLECPCCLSLCLVADIVCAGSCCLRRD